LLAIRASAAMVTPRSSESWRQGGVIRGWCWLSNLDEELTSRLGADKLQQSQQLLVEVTDMPHDSTRARRPAANPSGPHQHTQLDGGLCGRPAYAHITQIDAPRSATPGNWNPRQIGGYLKSIWDKPWW
jgi:hypothetical protein